MNKTIILHICLSKGWGGLEMYPSRVGKELLHRGYQVFGLCLDNTKVADSFHFVGMTTFFSSSKQKLVTIQLLALNQWVKENGITHIHCHKSGDLLVAALLKQLQPQLKVFFTEHMGVTRPKKSLYHRWVYSKVNQIFSISNATYQRNVKALPVTRDQISVLWLGTDISDFTPIEDSEKKQLHKELELRTDYLTIGCVGRLCDGKGQKELIEAFGYLKESVPNTQLIIVGGLLEQEGADVDYVDKLQTIAKKSAAYRDIHFTGFRSDTKKLLSLMDIVCIPSHNEAFGLTVIEAMAATKAIVGSNTGAIPEIVANTGLLCTPTSAQDIARKLKQYVDSESLMNNNAALARQRALQEFAMDSHIEKLLKRYYQY